MSASGSNTNKSMYLLRRYSDRSKCNAGKKIFYSTDPAVKQEANRNAFAKFDKDRSQGKSTSSTESDPTVRYDGE